MGEDVSELTNDLVEEVRLRVARVEWRDGDLCRSALLVSHGGRVEAHWVGWRHGADGFPHDGGTVALGPDAMGAERFDVAGSVRGEGSPLADVLLSEGSAALGSLVGGRGLGRDALVGVALALAPSHGLLLDGLGRGCAELLIRLGVDQSTVGDYAGPDLRRSWRRQAARRYPTFARHLTGPGCGAVLSAVDGGRPFEAALARFASTWIDGEAGLRPVTAAAVRRLRGVRLAGTHLGHAAWAMAVLPAEWLPVDQPGWEALVTVAATYRASGLPTPHAMRMLEGGKRRWVAYLDKLRVEGLDPSLPHVSATGADKLRRMLGDVTTTLAIPAVRHVAGGARRDAVTRTAMEVAFAGRGLRRALKASRDHSLWAGWILGQMPDRLANRSWPALLPDFVTSSGLLVTTLSNVEALRADDDGGFDEHKVAGLRNGARAEAEACLSGDAHVVSVRDPARRGVRLGSVVVVVSPDGTPSIGRRLGRGPRKGPDAVTGAVLEAIGAVADGRLTVGADASAPRGAVSPRDAPPEGSPYDWRDGRNLAGALSTWGKRLRSPWRRATLDDLLALAEGAARRSWVRTDMPVDRDLPGHGR